MFFLKNIACVPIFTIFAIKKTKQQLNNNENEH